MFIKFCMVDELRFMEQNRAEFAKLKGKKAKDALKLAWAKELEGQITKKQSKEDSQIDTQATSLKGEWVPYRGLHSYFGKRKAAAQYAKSCEQQGPTWWAWNKMAGVKLYRLVRKEEEQKLEQKREIKSQQEVVGSEQRGAVVIQRTPLKPEGCPLMISLHHLGLLVLLEFVPCHRLIPLFPSLLQGKGERAGVLTAMSMDACKLENVGAMLYMYVNETRKRNAAEPQQCV